jgi:hypothetical protein
MASDVEPRPDVPFEILDAMRQICLAFPEAYEESAWVGTRWCIRKKNFAHVVAIEAGWPPAYARAAGNDGPITVLTFRAHPPDREALGQSGHPFFLPVWFDDIVGMVLGGDTDWEEVTELVTDSYCALAPKKLAEQVRGSTP